MYSILKGFSTIAMTYGVTLLVMALCLWLYQTWHKKKHGPIPKGRMKTINIVMFIAAALIALPISFAKISGSKRKTAAYRMASLAQEQMETNRKRQEEAVAKLNAGIPDPRPLRAPDDLATRRELKEKQDAEAARQRREAKEQHEQRIREMQEKHASRRRNMDQVLEMREADFYQPPAGPATPEQKALDAEIIAANQELQDLKAQRDAYETAYLESGEEQKRLMQERPIDSEKLREASSTLHESMREKIRMAGPINEKRREVINLLNARQKLGE